MNTKNVGLYIHIPFCKQKCQYCDFNSYAGKENLIETYMKWVEFELKGVGEGNRVDYENNLDDLIVVKSIYIGGGTPSFIDSKYIEKIMEIVKECYTIDSNAEITIEVNPGTVSQKKLETYLNSGINRISIGLQSTHNEILSKLGRVHSYEEFLYTYNLARKVGLKNINVDLMLGLPNQSLNDLQESITEVVNLEPEHISVYSLIIENGTPFCEKLEKQEIALPSDELERTMYWETKRKLEKAGYTHYEISNFAKPGFESKHNLSCWNQEEYIGIGASAHSYTNNVRYSNIDSIEDYIRNYENGNEIDNFVFHEKQNKESKMKEFMMLGLRKINGICIRDFKNKFGENPIYLYKKELEKLVNEELIEIDGDVIKLTNRGIDLANLVWEEFV